MKQNKIYIDSIVYVNEQGRQTPLFIIWNQKKYKVNEILDIKQDFIIYGTRCTKYECLINTFKRTIYLDKSDRWFVEKLEE